METDPVSKMLRSFVFFRISDEGHSLITCILYLWNNTEGLKLLTIAILGVHCGEDEIVL
jgi:hypothetical protein